MKCQHCGKSPSDGFTTLIRQNAKGEIGIWACESCNRLPVPNDVAHVIADIQKDQHAKH